MDAQHQNVASPQPGFHQGFIGNFGIVSYRYFRYLKTASQCQPLPDVNFLKNHLIL